MTLYQLQCGGACCLVGWSGGQYIRLSNYQHYGPIFLIQLYSIVSDTSNILQNDVGN